MKQNLIDHISLEECNIVKEHLLSIGFVQVWFQLRSGTFSFHIIIRSSSLDLDYYKRSMDLHRFVYTVTRNYSSSNYDYD